MQLRSGRNLQPNPSTVTIEEREEESQSEEDLEEKEKETNPRNQPIIQTEEIQAPTNPPYPERLAIEKSVASP